jgi:hypothetical protein
MLAGNPTFDDAAPISYVGGAAIPTPATQSSETLPLITEPQVSSPVPHDPLGRRSKNAAEGRRNDGPTPTSRTAPGTIPTGWTTTRSEVVIPGHGTIYWHDCLDSDANIDGPWVEELLFQRCSFFSDLMATVEIVGNPRMAERIQERLDRRM